MRSFYLRQVRRNDVRLLTVSIIALMLWAFRSALPIVQAQTNPTAVENALPGTIDAWDISGAGDSTIQGFASDISVNAGETVNFKIKTPSTNYRIDIYRLGYYGGAGARKVATVQPSANLPQSQPSCGVDATTGLIDCGNWAVSASWTSTGAVSGIYVAKLTRIDTGGVSHIVFIVRDDARQADVVVQTSDTTWQAYNRYGGGGLYCGGPISNLGTVYATTCLNRSVKVSYNRPFDTRDHDPQSFLFGAEYPMVRWLEANGYNVKYWAGVDTDRRGAELIGARKPKAFISMGHDEYWSGDQRTRIETARNAGVHLAFFSGNEIYWKTRYEPSIDGSNTPYRTLVSYKETLAGAKIDPAVDGNGKPIWTGTWRDPRFSPPADGGRPENGVTGNIWTVNTGTSAITVPASMSGLRFWRNTRVASLAAGAVATFTPESLGYEWDEDLDNGARPSGIVHLSATTVDGVEKIFDFGASTGIGTATHNLTLYRHSSGALVFGAGTVQWSWGLDGNHDRGAPAAHVPDQAMQQSTVNLLADMGAQPATLQAGLIATSASADMLAPTSVVTSPAAGTSVQSGDRVMISGTAVDNGGGGVASVEVSVDGGATWHAAQGTSTWSFVWSPGAPGSATIRSRAVDDSGNVETAGGGVLVPIGAGICPCTTIWKPSATPSVANSSDTSAVELGVKFKSDVDGFITGIRFYKGPNNTGTHVGTLWTNSGTRLAAATFSSERSSGWQQVTFATAVPIAANTTYVASYHTNVGGYSIDSGYFLNAGVNAFPLHALPSDAGGGNGVFTYVAGAFPAQTFNSSNYWVDVVFSETVIDAPPMQINNIGTRVIDGSTAIVTWTTTKEATSRIDYSTDPGLPTDPVGLTLTRTDGSFVLQHTMTLTGLTPMSTYYFNITAVDRDGQVAVVMAPSFSVPGPTLHDTVPADFLAGTATNTYAAETADGELILTPTSGTEFTGGAMPSGWLAVPWDRSGSASIGNGILIVDGARVATCLTDGSGACLAETKGATPSAVFTSPHTLEFSANFSGDRFQHAGFAQTLNSSTEPWAIFSTSSSGGQLFARTSSGTGIVTETAIGTAPIGAFHRYRIDWKADRVDYYLDGVLTVSHGPVAGAMRPVAASDFSPLGGTVFVDWIRMTPYAASGTFLSRVFDALAPVDWHAIQWTAGTPLGTSLAISIRTGDTPTPDGTWTAFAPVPAPGPLSLHSRYIQYRALLATSDTTLTPELDDIIITTGHAPVAMNDAAATNLNTALVFPASGPGSLKANDTDADADVLSVKSVTQPSQGTAVVNADRSVTYTPATGFTGTDVFTYTITDGLMTSSATVTINVGEVVHINHDPVANADSATVAEDSVANAINVLVNDNDGLDTGESLSVTGVTQGAHGSVAFTSLGVTYTPAANYNGPDSFIYTIGDGNGGVASATVSVTITAVNDAPSFTKGPDQIVFANAGPQMVASWATSLSPGPANEAGQTVSFVVSNSNNALFSAQPAIASNGTLTYTAGVNAVGSATVSVAIKDDGGTSNGGVDTSASQTFTITVGQGTTITANFNGTPISAGDFIWFNSVLKVQGVASNPVTIGFSGSVSFTANGKAYVVPVPSAIINFSPSAAVATTAFCNGQWVTTVPISGLSGNVFLDGMALQAPTPGGFPGGIKDISWRGIFVSVTPGLKVQWQWAAAVYHTANFGADYSALGVKATDDGKASVYQNADHAGTPETFRKYVIGGAEGGGGSNYTGSYTGTAASIPTLANLTTTCGGS